MNEIEAGGDGRTLLSKVAQTFFLARSNSPFFLKVRTRLSMADLVVGDKGRSEVLNFLRGVDVARSSSWGGLGGRELVEDMLPLRTIAGYLSIGALSHEYMSGCRTLCLHD